jgi:hypothetical protein
VAHRLITQNIVGETAHIFFVTETFFSRFEKMDCVPITSVSVTLFYANATSISVAEKTVGQAWKQATHQQLALKPA